MTTAATYDAYVSLLAQPDLPCLPARTRRYTYAGDPHRRERLKLELQRAWLTRRLEAAADVSSVISVRRSKLRIVRSA